MFPFDVSQKPRAVLAPLQAFHLKQMEGRRKKEGRKKMLILKPISIIVLQVELLYYTYLVLLVGHLVCFLF